MEIINFNDISPEPKRVIAIGKFDGIHKGHARLLECAVKKARGLKASSMAYIIEPPSGMKITGRAEKLNIVKSFGIDSVCIEEMSSGFMNMTPAEFVQNVLCNTLSVCHAVVGYNFKFGRGRSGDAQTLKSLCAEKNIGVSIIDCVYTEENGQKIAVNSSEIRRLMSIGSVEKIEPLMGRRYSLSDIVKSGKKLGAKIGFPTANLYRSDSDFPLKRGVYLTKVHTEDGIFTGITNVGSNPTVEKKDGLIRVETHLIDFDGNLYGKKIDVEFVRYMREERKFSSVQELKNQLKSDKKFAENTIIE